MPKSVVVCLTFVAVFSFSIQFFTEMVKSSTNRNLKDLLKTSLAALLEENGYPVDNESLESIPHHWELFQDLVLFPENVFRSPALTELGDKVWNVVANVFKVSRVARHGKIQSNDFRSPRLEMLLGSDTWVRKKDNGIIYELDLSRSMFSSGNITEKIRMSKMNCKHEVVVDLFAGIGYFTIPLLKAGVEKVIACEWNPAAVEALKRNLVLNHVEDRCEILFGDNRLTCPSNIADRVILGLIPTSESSWSVASRALRGTGGILHVHCNVDSRRSHDAELSSSASFHERIKICDNVLFKKPEFRNAAIKLMDNLLLICDEQRERDSPWKCFLLHCGIVKSYAPKVYHCVFDINLKPSD